MTLKDPCVLDIGTLSMKYILCNIERVSHYNLNLNLPEFCPNGGHVGGQGQAIESLESSRLVPNRRASVGPWLDRKNVSKMAASYSLDWAAIMS